MAKIPMAAAINMDKIIGLRQVQGLSVPPQQTFYVLEDGLQRQAKRKRSILLWIAGIAAALLVLHAFWPRGGSRR